MRILKYLFLLLLLSFVALTIFIATQKGDFTLERSTVINSPKSTVFNFVNDFRNWEDFGLWTTEDPKIKINYPDKTIGTGASYFWEGKEGFGDIKTTFVRENDSISQVMNYNGTSSSLFWSFKDTIGGTKVTWKTKGKMSFTMKIHTALNGGVGKVIGQMFEKSLASLDKTLDFEINTYNVKVNGLSKKLGTFYLKQTFTSKISNINKNSRIVFFKIMAFCSQNNIDLNGKPFLLYHTYNSANGLARISFCIPIKSQILTSSGSDILAGKLESFDAVKTTLRGDYSHMEKALEKTQSYIMTKKIKVAPTFSHLEIFIINKSDSKSPSKWITEIYVPIPPKLIQAKDTVPTPLKRVEAIKITEPVINKEEEHLEF